MNNVAVCVCTRGRFEMLRSCLRGLNRMDLPNDCDVSIVVVDNNPDDDSIAHVESIVDDEITQAPVFLVHEPKLGVSPARNAAIRKARQLGAAWIAFIDDDEVPERDWLVQLLSAAAEHEADAIHGIVRYKFPENCPSWRRRNPWGDWGKAEGMVLDSAGTGNVLFRVSMAAGLEFNESQGMIGGEDSRFFRRFHNAGGRIVLSLRPVVTETVPWARLTMRGFVKKHFRIGVSKVEYRTMDGRRTRIWFPLRRALKGFLHLLSAPFLGLSAMLAGICCLCESAGMVWSMSGRRFQYYKNVTGY